MAFNPPMLTPVQLAIVALMVNDQTRAQQIDPNKGYTQVPEILTKMHAQYGLHPMHELDTLLEYEVIELPPRAPNAIPGVPMNSVRITRPVLDSWTVGVGVQINRARQNGTWPKRVQAEHPPQVEPPATTLPPPPIIEVPEVAAETEETDALAAEIANDLAKAMGVEPPHPDLARLGITQPIDAAAPKRGRGRPKKDEVPDSAT